MTWITDDSGTRWVQLPLRKRRKSPRALRFADLKVGDQLMRHFNMPMSATGAARITWYYIVTDLWFDPVAGQDDEIAGKMVGIRMLDQRTGEAREHKEPHTLRGLASQGFQYSDIDFAALVTAKNEARAAGVVVGISQGHVIRARPKIPGERF